MFAEAVWISAKDGYNILPLEIAFANRYNETFVFQIVPPSTLWLTVRDIAKNKSRFLNRDRFSNYDSWRSISRSPIIEYRLKSYNWLSRLIDFMKKNCDTLFVRGPLQQWFFKEICGWKSVETINCPNPITRNSDVEIVGYPHKHYSKFMSERPCAVVEVKTMVEDYRKWLRFPKVNGFNF